MPPTSRLRFRFRPALELLENRLAPAVSAVDDPYFLWAGDTLVAPGGQTYLAESGFNDASGIHSDPVPNSPYQLGASIHGRGGPEPGWTSSWVVSDGGCGCGFHLGEAVESPVYEGDGSLHIFLGPARQTWVHRAFAPQDDLFLLEQRLRLPANGGFGSRPYGYGSQPLSFGPVWGAQNGRFLVYQGDGQGGVTPIDTGIPVQPLRWHKVSLLVDVANQRYSFFVDGIPYESAVPLRFRGNPFSIYNVDYLADTDVWLDAIRIRPLERHIPRGVLQSDITSAEGPLTARLIEWPTHGKVRFRADGGFTYIPAPGFVGTDHFSYRVVDGAGDQDIGRATFTVLPPRQYPIARDDAYAVAPGATLVVGRGGNLQIVAQSGFNDASGLNANGLPNSPFQLGETVHGRGLEPGWASGWVVSAGGGSGGEHRGRAETSRVYEGDGALHVYVGSDATWVHRPWAEPQFDRFILEQRVALPAGSYLGSRPYGPGGFGPLWGVQNGRFLVYQGNGAGGAQPIDTGWTAIPHLGHLVTLSVDVARQTFEFFLDGQRFEYSEPLRFRERPTSITQIDYLAGSEVWIDAVRMFSVGDLVIDGVLSNDQSLTGGLLSATLQNGPSNGTLSFGSNGGFRYTPNPGFTGGDRFTYGISDGTWESNVATVTIQVGGRDGGGAELVPALLAGARTQPVGEVVSEGDRLRGADRVPVAEEREGFRPAGLDAEAEDGSGLDPGTSVPALDVPLNGVEGQAPGKVLLP